MRPSVKVNRCILNEPVFVWGEEYSDYTCCVKSRAMKSAILLRSKFFLAMLFPFMAVPGDNIACDLCAF